VELRQRGDAHLVERRLRPQRVGGPCPHADVTRISCYTDFVKNVTITLDEQTARWARLEAARRETSVSRLVGELLTRYMLETDGYETAMEEFLSRPARPLNGRRTAYPTREELHDRGRLR